jgi:molybdopterin-containing oxidoreductase family iron-sulfur binding subunit
MEKSNKRYWKGIEELTNDPAFVKHAEKEFPEFLPMAEQNGSGESNSRRDFLKLMGFGIAAATLAACETPVRKAIPYLNKPVDVDPGIPNYYASTYTAGGDYASIVVKTREGRPIKIEGNRMSPITKGGSSAQIEGAVLSLYDKHRFTGPIHEGAAIAWADLDANIASALGNISTQGGAIRVISNSVLSPSFKAAVGQFAATFPGTEHITYDPSSAYGMIKANEINFAKAAIPSYDFSKAKTIVSFGADFLGTWISPVEFTKQYAQTRKVSKSRPEMSRHYQFETILSLTGANADYRTSIRPSQEGLAVATLYNMIARRMGRPTVNAGGEFLHLEEAAADLMNSRGASLVVSSSNDPNVQIMVNLINSMLENYGATINLSRAAHYRQGNDEAMASFIADLNAGRVKGVIFYDCNPVYDHPMGAQLAEAIAKASVSVAITDRASETTTAVKTIAPDHHFLESWGDAEPVEGHYSLAQPTITNLFDTRQALSTLLTWAGSETTDAYEYIREQWRNTTFANQTDVTDFDLFWDKTLHDGVYADASFVPAEISLINDNLSAAAAAIAKDYSMDNTNTELVLYQKIGIGTGRQANNPWLQEMPDPISKVTWDNYVTISQRDANALGVVMKEGFTTRANVTVDGATVNLPVVVQPGQAPGTIGIALGYGRTNGGRVADGLGANVGPWQAVKNGIVHSFRTEGVNLQGTGEAYQIAQTQTHQTYMERDFVVQEATLAEYKEDAFAGRYRPRIYKEGEFVKPSTISLWKGHRYSNHHWGMTIDMNSCTGCGACTVACQAENNIPVVGRQEVVNRREMHWIRIDRYYSSDADVSDLKGLEQAADNPDVVFQPMLCQQCNNAPCETVCPVAATTHSSEGLNQMTYNRCIGTRYCANNCPYKVRRFNWFKYHDNTQFDKNLAMNNDLGKMVLNPDVTVRARGVMEKCTFCVQRIQAGKLQARKEGRRPVDGEVVTACQSACPADAIVFGDMNDSESAIYKMLRIKEEEETKTVQEERAYHMLEDINVNPNIWYFTKIRNKNKEGVNA